MDDIDHKIHVAFIVDGNGRWAKQRKKPRTFGHKEGVKRLNELIEALRNNDELSCLSFYIFSLENWKRSKEEISFLFKYLKDYLTNNSHRLNEWNIKFHWSGFNENLDNSLIKLLRDLEDATKDNKGLIINFVFNYGGVQDIVQAANKLRNYPDEITYEVFKNNLLTSYVPEVDLLIRTSGEKRISNYLLFLLAYAEFIFEDTKWPDYTVEIFLKNLEEFKSRDIRKGGYSKRDSE